MHPRNNPRSSGGGFWPRVRGSGGASSEFWGRSSIYPVYPIVDTSIGDLLLWESPVAEPRHTGENETELTGVCWIEKPPHPLLGADGGLIVGGLRCPFARIRRGMVDHKISAV